MVKYLVLAFLGFLAFVFVISDPISSDDLAKAKTVKLELENVGSCSGEQIQAPSGKTYILTAGHCKSLKGEKNSITVIKENGESLERAIIAEDLNSDLLLLEGLPNQSGLKIAEEIYTGEHVRTFTHGRGLPTYKSEGVLITDIKIQISMGIIGLDFSDACEGSKYQKMPLEFGGIACILSVREMVSTAFIVPGSSGGMVVNNQGELVGVVSAGDGAFGYFVDLNDIRKFVAGY